MNKKRRTRAAAAAAVAALTPVVAAAPPAEAAPHDSWSKWRTVASDTCTIQYRDGGKAHTKLILQERTNRRYTHQRAVLVYSVPWQSRGWGRRYLITTAHASIKRTYAAGRNKRLSVSERTNTRHWDGRMEIDPIDHTRKVTVEANVQYRALDALRPTVPAFKGCRLRVTHDPGFGSGGSF